MKKNDTITLEITDYTAEGSGIGRYEGMAVFVPNTAKGDEVKVKIVKLKPNYAFGKLIGIIKTSAERVQNDCEYSDKCGGCVFRHIDYKSELEFKTQRVSETLKRIGGADVPCKGVFGAEDPDSYRNKAQFPFSETYATGFFAPRSHRVVPIKNCKLLPDIFNRISECVSDFCQSKKISVYNEESGNGLLRHLYIRKGAVSGEIMAVIVINGDTLPFSDELANDLLLLLGDSLKSFQININTNRNNVILGNRNIVVYGRPYINDTLCGVNVRLSPFTFYQINHSVAEKLYEKAKEYAAPEGKSVIDLYCGAGTIGLSMANVAKSVIGVEIVPEAVSDAKNNADLNGIKNAEFICGDASAAADILAKRGIKSDIVILDPPRKGCEEKLLHTVSKDFSPERIVYVSCDPATLARDIRILNGLGYNAREYSVFDMFPRTAHVETVVQLLRR